MKRLFIFLLASMLFACEKVEESGAPEPTTTSFNFGKITATTTETTASITADIPYVQIDGKYDHEAKLTLFYHDTESIDCSLVEITEYELLIGEVRFLLRNLKPETVYSAFLQLESSTGEQATSDHFEFVTKAGDTGDSKGLTINIDSHRGLFATVRLSDIHYKENNVDVALESLRFEYRRADNIYYQEWFTYEFGAEEISDGEVVFEIPGEDDTYLDELTTYEYVIVMIPEDDNYQTYTFGEGHKYYRFKMGYAEISASFTTPRVTLDDNIVRVAVDRVDLYYDGVSIDDYEFGYPSYAIRYRIKGEDEWTQKTVYRKDGAISDAFGVHDAAPNTTYEIVAVVYAGASRTACYSETVEICVNPTN